MRQGARTDLQPSANLPEVSQARAAEMLNVSERSVRSAAKMLHEGSEDLIHAVERGDMAVSAATHVGVPDT